MVGSLFYPLLQSGSLPAGQEVHPYTLGGIASMSVKLVMTKIANPILLLVPINQIIGVSMICMVM